MERGSSRHELNEDDDRRSRFQNTTSNENGSSSLRDRASSQPPGTSDNTPFLSSPTSQYLFPSNVGGPWTGSRILNPSRVQPVPIRSSSLSTNPQVQFSSVMRERAFPSTFEDDESEALSDTYDELYVPQSLSRGRAYAQDPSRSRSQSLATSRPVGSPYTGTSAMQNWNESLRSSTNPLNIPRGQQRYGEIKPPGSSRYGSLGTLARSPINIHSSSSPSGASFVANGFSNRNQQADITNMSPFVRDVGQILLDDGAAFRELWAGMHPPRDENGGGGSGTTSRRHSVSVVQPRRGNVVGFHAPGDDVVEEEPPSRSSFQPAYGRSGLLLSDDDLASDLGSLNIKPNEPPPSSSQHPTSQPSSLPIFAPLSRSPPSRDLMSTYQSINLSIPGGNTYSRQGVGTPSEGEFSAGGNNSPGLYEQHLTESHFNSGRSAQLQQHQQQSELTARYIPGQGIQYMPPQQQQQGGMHHPPSPQYGRTRAPSYSGSSNLSPISPTTGRAINPQQPPYYPQTQRRLSDAQHHLPPSSSQHQSHHQQNLSDLGKGVPLHAVPPSWPLFIVEFKAGRTDLFYLTDLSQNIRAGDLVMVEADRGKDLGTVVNDSITLAEVEAFQRQQMERGFGGGGSGSGSGEPTSPGGMSSGAGNGGMGKKEINPKMIYGKASAQEMQLLAAKNQDEQKALQLCQTKVRAKKLPMEVIDAEYQWDRRKLTFYFVAEKRIDFRELVRELFRLYKTRIWMASLQGSGEYEQ
ncbi:PSP1-domain-containing protein [Phlegmacium glaucopus]|nr:PSP1-domain-containing protein [Phlegmacium glaucopus]